MTNFSGKNLKDCAGQTDIETCSNTDDHSETTPVFLNLPTGFTDEALILPSSYRTLCRYSSHYHTVIIYALGVEAINRSVHQCSDVASVDPIKDIGRGSLRSVSLRTGVA